jgi:undecaprenyl-diphosphatase
VRDRLKRVDAASSFLVALPEQRWLSPIERAAATGNGLPIWGAASVGLAVTGARGRRAAGEGLVALGVVSTLSNLVVKPLVHRRRPFPFPRRTTPKATRSFPSSHAATAHAFATAVTCRWPAAGLPLLAVAGTVAGSRVHARQHRISEVLFGAALGVVTGAGLHLVSERVVPPGDGRDQSLGSTSVRKKSKNPC